MTLDDYMTRFLCNDCIYKIKDFRIPPSTEGGRPKYRVICSIKAILPPQRECEYYTRKEVNNNEEENP